ncbi:hypothetical protein E2C01_079327 [Portunus trituberculatus]|uniref:Uncharacterized protein n=1 Tax=Portunus trituberculatus TaxID=210409 RepID=A0A5B7IQ10_PORTR|nr:hypothetical protein [Portunus trituberculatus]
MCPSTEGVNEMVFTVTSLGAWSVGLKHKGLSCWTPYCTVTISPIHTFWRTTTRPAPTDCGIHGRTSRAKEHFKYILMSYKDLQ